MSLTASQNHAKNYFYSAKQHALIFHSSILICRATDWKVESLLFKYLHPHPIFWPSSVFYKRNIQCELSPILSHKHEKMAKEISERIFKYHHLAQSSFPPTGPREVPWVHTMGKFMGTNWDSHYLTSILHPKYIVQALLQLCVNMVEALTSLSLPQEESPELSYTEFVGSAPKEDTPHRVRLVTHFEECSPGVDYEVWIDLLELQGLTVACLNLPLSSAMSEACLFVFLEVIFASPRCKSDSNCGGGSFKDDHNENVCTIKSSDC